VEREDLETYGELAAAVRPLWIRDWRIRTAGHLALPGNEIRPGVVARSVLIGFLGLSPQLRVNFPDLAEQLLSGAPAGGSVRLHRRGVVGVAGGPARRR
jgi:hypothetical protein